MYEITPGIFKTLNELDIDELLKFFDYYHSKIYKYGKLRPPQFVVNSAQNHLAAMMPRMLELGLIVAK